MCTYRKFTWTVAEPSPVDATSSTENSMESFKRTKHSDPSSARATVDTVDTWSNLTDRVKTLEDALKSLAEPPVASPSPIARNSPLIGQHSENSEDANVVRNQDDLINFHDDKYPDPGYKNRGPLTWMSLLRKDKFSNAFTRAIRGSAGADTSEYGDDSAYQEFAKATASHETDPISWKGTTENDIVSVVKTFLKDSKLVWLLFDKFFESELAMIIPVLEREEFDLEVVKLIGERGSKNSFCNFHSKSQCATAGTLLLLMRIASLASHIEAEYIKQGEFTEAEKYILANPVHGDILRASDRCKAEAKSLRRPPFRLFQLILCKRYYELIAPESCDCIKQTPPDKFGELLHYAFLFSVNRDPSKVPNAWTSNANYIRRLWCMVMNLDRNQMMITGGPSMINPTLYDTQLPVMTQCETETDFTIDSDLNTFSESTNLLDKLLREVLSVRYALTSAELIQRLKPIEAMLEKLPSIEQVLAVPSTTVLERIQKMRRLFEVFNIVCLMMLIYYHLFIHFGVRLDHDNTLFYCLQVLKVAGSAFPAVLFLNDNCEEYNMYRHFGCPSLVMPKLEVFLHKAVQMLGCIVIRVKMLKMIQRSLPLDDIVVLDKVVSIIFVSLRHLLNGFKKMAPHYFHAWIVSKVHSFLVNRLAKVEPGPFLSATLMETECIAIFQKLGPDDAFFSFSIKDLELILDALKPFQRVNTVGRFGLSDLGSKTTEDNDKWIKHMFQELTMRRAENSDFMDQLFPAGTANGSQTGTTGPSNGVELADQYLEFTGAEYEGFLINHSLGFGSQLPL